MKLIKDKSEDNVADLRTEIIELAERFMTLERLAGFRLWPEVERPSREADMRQVSGHETVTLLEAT